MATTQSLGRVSIMPKGEFDESTQYERLDLVEYNGSSYLALKTSVGNLPTDSNYFQLIAEKGDTGATGATGATGQTGATGRGVSSIVMSNEGTSHPITAIYSDSTEETIGTIKDGSGGDMYKADYGSDTDGVVAYAKALTDGTNTVTPTTVMGKADKSTTYTKTEVDALVDDIEINWTEVQSKPFSTVSNDLSISSSGALGLTDDEKNKLGVALTSDKYSTAKTYSKDELAILNNKVYKSKVDNNLNHAVTETGYWEETTLGEELGALNTALTNLNKLVKNQIVVPLIFKEYNSNYLAFVSVPKGNNITVTKIIVAGKGDKTSEFTVDTNGASEGYITINTNASTYISYPMRAYITIS